MKAFTVWQPWASLLAAGVKRYETRSWATDHRGPLAIHAAKREPRAEELNLPGIVTAMLDADLREAYGWDLPRGKVLAVAELMAVYPIDADAVAEISDRERRLGDWQPGRYAWELEIEYTVTPPQPARGQQRLWEWEGGT